MTKQFQWFVVLGATALCLSGCSRPPQNRTDFAMGERIPVGQMSYSVVESSWRTQLGEAFRVRTPENRFLLIRISATNGTGSDVSIPLLTLDGANGQTYRELASGEGVENWFGLLRTISPGQTQQGNIVFDVPLASYKLRLPDVKDLGLDQFVTVQIPLRMDPDLPIQSPIAPDSLK